MYLINGNGSLNSTHETRVVEQLTQFIIHYYPGYYYCFIINNIFSVYLNLSNVRRYFTLLLFNAFDAVGKAFVVVNFELFNHFITKKFKSNWVAGGTKKGVFDNHVQYLRNRSLNSPVQNSHLSASFIQIRSVPKKRPRTTDGEDEESLSSNQSNSQQQETDEQIMNDLDEMHRQEEIVANANRQKARDTNSAMEIMDAYKET